MEQSLAQKIALVTGASRGLGLAIARHLARQGANVALLARDAAALDSAREQVQREAVDPSRRIQTYAVDLADESQVERVTRQCIADFGGLDIVVNNAAIQGPIGPFHAQDWTAWREVFQVNFLAPARVCQIAIPVLKDRGWGKIVNLSGGGATSPRPDLSAYAAAKCALVRLSETLAEELRGSGIDVNCVAPGPMNTRMLEELLAAGPTAARREYHRACQQAQNGGASPQKAANLVAWLASSASDGVSGRLVSAVWDDWQTFPEKKAQIEGSDLFTLRRIVPKDRGLAW